MGGCMSLFKSNKKRNHYWKRLPFVQKSRNNSTPSYATVLKRNCSFDEKMSDREAKKDYDSHENLRTCLFSASANSGAKVSINRFGFRGKCQNNAAAMNSEMPSTHNGVTDKLQAPSFPKSISNDMKEERENNASSKMNRNTGIPVLNLNSKVKSKIPVRPGLSKGNLKKKDKSLINTMKLQNNPTSKTMDEIKKEGNIVIEDVEVIVRVQVNKNINANGAESAEEHATATAKNGGNSVICEVPKASHENAIPTSESCSHLAQDEFSVVDFDSDSDGDQLQLLNQTYITSDGNESREEQNACGEGDEISGLGEALAFDDLEMMKASSSLQSERKPAVGTNVPLRKILLAVEDTSFASLALISEDGPDINIEDVSFPNIPVFILEDENAPVDISPETKTNPVEKSHEIESGNSHVLENMTHPILTPVPPTFSSCEIASGECVSETMNFEQCFPNNRDDKSASSSTCTDGEGDVKDYFDDEIADQPALCFDKCSLKFIPSSGASSTNDLLHSTPSTPHIHPCHSRYVQSPLPVFNKDEGGEFLPPACVKSKIIPTDLGISDCSSMNSDDLMMDFEISDNSGPSSLETARLREVSEAVNMDSFSKSNSNGSVNVSVFSTLSLQPHPQNASHDNKDEYSVMGSSGLLQEVASIKSSLHQLFDVLSKGPNVDDDAHCSKPPDGSDCKCNKEEMNDLRKQVTLLQHQMLEKDKIIYALREELVRCKNNAEKCDKLSQLQERRFTNQKQAVLAEKVVAATQTERVRSSIPLCDIYYSINAREKLMESEQTVVRKK